MTIFDTIAAKESSGNPTVINPASTSSGHAAGLYQITSGTWHDFAPTAGVSLAQYPTADTAPVNVQTAVASNIPLSRWAPGTVAAVQQQYGAVNTSLPVGQIASGLGQQSSIPAGPVATDPSATGGAQPGLPFSTDYGQGAGFAPQGTSGLSGAASNATAAIPGLLLDEPFTFGLAPGLPSAITGWIGGIETSVGNAFKGAVSAVTGSVTNYFLRFMLILTGLVVVAIALWRLIAPDVSAADVAKAVG